MDLAGLNRKSKMAQDPFLETVRTLNKADFYALLNSPTVDISVEDNAAVWSLLNVLVGAQDWTEIGIAYEMLYALIYNERFDPSRGGNDLLFAVADIDLGPAREILDHLKFDA